jgi:hypothetical protein
LATIFAAGPASDVTVAVTGEILATVIVKEFVPGVLPRVHSPTEVGPLADTVGELLNVPPPTDTTTVTLTPAIALPFWSFTTNVGLVGSATPAAALLGGAVTNSTDVGTRGAEVSWHAYKVRTQERKRSE